LIALYVCHIDNTPEQVHLLLNKGYHTRAHNCIRHTPAFLPLIQVKQTYLHLIR